MSEATRRKDTAPYSSPRAMSEKLTLLNAGCVFADLRHRELPSLDSLAERFRHETCFLVRRPPTTPSAMQPKNVFAALSLAVLSTGAGAAWVPYTVNALFDDGGSLTGTVRVNTQALTGVGIFDVDLVSTTASSFVGATYRGLSDFSSGGGTSVATLEEASNPAGAFLGLYFPAPYLNLQALAASYNFLNISYESRSGGERRSVVSGGMTQQPLAVPSPGTLALVGLALLAGMCAQSLRVRARNDADVMA